jgi:hypothetical protein
MTNNRRRSIKTQTCGLRYLLPFTGRRKSDRIKTALELLVCVVGIVAACSMPVYYAAEAEAADRLAEPDELLFIGEVNIPEGSGTGTLSVALREVWTGARSLAGAGSGDIMDGVGRLRNIYQPGQEPPCLW